jgi:hypothetical protein
MQQMLGYGGRRCVFDLAKQMVFKQRDVSSTLMDLQEPALHQQSQASTINS